MLVLTIVTVLQFCKLRYKMLVKPITLSLWYYVKDNVVLQALCSSSNCLYTKSKSTMLRPLKGEFGYELSRSKWSNSDSSSSGFSLLNWLNSLIVLSNRPFLHLSMADNVIAFRCSSVIYPHLLLSPSHFQNSLSTFSIERVNGIPLWDIYLSDFQRTLKIIIIAELLIVMTISQGQLRHNNSDNEEKCSFTIVRPYGKLLQKDICKLWLSSTGGRGPLRQTFAPPEIWSENNRQIGITKEICIAIDFAPPPPKKIPGSKSELKLQKNFCVNLTSFPRAIINVLNV